VIFQQPDTCAKLSGLCRCAARVAEAHRRIRQDTGHNDRQWVANIDFALQAGKATELAEKATQQAPQSAGAMNHGNVQHHRTATDQRYIDQIAARDERRAREATEHPEAALPVLQ
jgi:hypothetical protein